MQPFPTVRIKGYLVRSGARITLLSVTAPARTRVSVTCRGRGCPVRRSSAVVSRATLRVSAFERTLRAGVRLTIRITSPGRVGKLTSIRIRRDRVPLRHDGCLARAGRGP